MSNCTVASPRSTRIPVSSSVGKTGSGAATSPSTNSPRNGRQNPRGGTNGGGRRGVGNSRAATGEAGGMNDVVTKDGDKGGIKDITDLKSMHTVIAVSPKTRNGVGTCEPRSAAHLGNLKSPNKSNIFVSNAIDSNQGNFQEQKDGRKHSRCYNEVDVGSLVVGKKGKKACTVITTIATIEYVNDRKYNLLSSPEEDEGFSQERKHLDDIAEFEVSNRTKETTDLSFSEAGRRRQKRYLQNHLNRYSVPDYSSDSGRTSWGSSDTGVRDDISTSLTSPLGPSRPCFPGNSIESFMPCNNNHQNTLNNNNTNNNNSSSNTNAKHRYRIASPTLPSPVASTMHLTTTSACGNNGNTSGNNNNNNNNNYSGRSNSRGSLLQMQSSTSSSHSFSSSASHHPSSSSLSSPTSMSSSSTYASHIPTYHYQRRGRSTPQSSTPSPSGDTSSDRASDSGDGAGVATYVNVASASNPSPPNLPNGLHNLIAEGKNKVGLNQQKNATRSQPDKENNIDSFREHWLSVSSLCHPR
ncbi:hypothetical protein ElyMa_007071200 [Elysia marginata]|uniref:Uncharacterized protein n=1 Tax=Elysia marginata TaxID=1093978 RepID=A0AAV4JYZ4_9GAST|nr:hypothetical protein ElyMa_007071200 [Elysia marginata]